MEIALIKRQFLVYSFSFFEKKTVNRSIIFVDNFFQSNCQAEPTDGTKISEETNSTDKMQQCNLMTRAFLGFICWKNKWDKSYRLLTYHEFRTLHNQ